MNPQSKPVSISSTTGNAQDEVFDNFLQRVRARFASATQGNAPLFTTDASGLFEAYLASFPEPERQHHNCHACRDFFRKYGGLVAIAPGGETRSALWDIGDGEAGIYGAPARAVARLVSRANVTGVFYSSAAVWGSPETGPWRHLSVELRETAVFKHKLLSPTQAAAEKREDFATMARALAEYTPEVIAQAVTLLKTETLYRSDKCLGVAEWLRDLHRRRSEAHGTARRDNVLWLSVAGAPPGFCHPRTSMIGTLLDDIAAGLSTGVVKERFDAKMNPTQYQRPQAAPTAGNIAQAEKVVAQLGIERSLRRRFARIDEVETLWRAPEPKAVVPPAGSVFSHLQPKGRAQETFYATPATVTMTWEKFRRTVLPEAESIEYFAPHGNGSYGALVTAVDPLAPPILQWDSEDDDARNPVSWYLWSGGSVPRLWNLTGGTYCKVNAVTLLPWMWTRTRPRVSHFPQGVMFILDGARETRTEGGVGLALFPEILKSELRSIRSTIEAYSNKGALEGVEEATACGVLFQQSGSGWSGGTKGQFRVLSDGAQIIYHLDRWD